MKFNKSLLGLAVVTAMQSAMAEEINTNPVVVSSSRYPVNEYNASFATEIYSAQDIEESGATSLYDFLGQYTSINVLPSYGNLFSQRIDMRGYGIGDGYQNIAITVDGQRLNNIDMVPQLLGAIPLSNIERIEITKGSGSVQYGDNAMAGAIHIITKDATGVTLGGAIGGFGATRATVSAGLQGDDFALSASAENKHLDGYSEADVTGQKDSSDSHILNVKAKYFATDKLELRLGGSQSNILTAYAGPLTEAQFQSDPAQNGGNTYNRQQFLDSNSSGGFTYDFLPTLKLVYDQHMETKTSTYLAPFPYSADYQYDSSNLALQYQHSGTKVVVGTDQFNGTRIGSSNDTSKDNNGFYIQSAFELGDATWSAGMRTAQVDYRYAPSSGTALAASNHLSAYDIGYNRKLNRNTSWFMNINHAYQAPDVDRFFDWTGTFNAFIQPAISDTLNVGLSQFHADSSWKLSSFYADLNNEIYYNPLTFTNTNIDKSHKYGIEGQYKSALTDSLSTKLVYTYTKAIIDRENDGGGAYNGKSLPGVPEHSLSASLKYRISKQSFVTLDHTYRSETYAAEDFANNFTQKQAAYNVTNLDYRHRIKNTVVYLRVENLFESANGIWIHDDAIYPVNFRRTWQLGFTTRF